MHGYGIAGALGLIGRRVSLALLSWLIVGMAILPARADLLISATIGTLPFGPFTPREEIVVTGSIVNVSNQDVIVCEGLGPCVGANVGAAYELGGFASSPNGYTFSFGDGSDPRAGFLDGKASGTYAPGQEKSFVFGEYTPDGGIAAPGTYSFGDQLQIFAATPDRPMVGSTSFGGTWQVVPKKPKSKRGHVDPFRTDDDPASVPEPSSLALLGAGLLRARCGQSRLIKFDRAIVRHAGELKTFMRR